MTTREPEDTNDDDDGDDGDDGGQEAQEATKVRPRGGPRGAREAPNRHPEVTKAWGCRFS